LYDYWVVESFQHKNDFNSVGVPGDTILTIGDQIPLDSSTPLRSFKHRIPLTICTVSSPFARTQLLPGFLDDFVTARQDLNRRTLLIMITLHLFLASKITLTQNTDFQYRFCALALVAYMVVEGYACGSDDIFRHDFRRSWSLVDVTKTDFLESRYVLRSHGIKDTAIVPSSRHSYQRTIILQVLCISYPLLGQSIDLATRSVPTPSDSNVLGDHNSFAQGTQASKPICQNVSHPACRLPILTLVTPAIRYSRTSCKQRGANVDLLRTDSTHQYTFRSWRLACFRTLASPTVDPSDASLKIFGSLHTSLQTSTHEAMACAGPDTTCVDRTKMVVMLRRCEASSHAYSVKNYDQNGYGSVSGAPTELTISFSAYDELRHKMSAFDIGLACFSNQ
ncbi:hypothetical protein KCU65_g486, partial [Aureobasidium melanogenum]